MQWANTYSPQNVYIWANEVCMYVNGIMAPTFTLSVRAWTVESQRPFMPRAVRRLA